MNNLYLPSAVLIAQHTTREVGTTETTTFSSNSISFIWSHFIMTWKLKDGLPFSKSFNLLLVCTKALGWGLVIRRVCCVFRIVSLSCSPTGGAFVCSAATSKKSLTSPLRLSQSFSKYSEMSTLTSNSLSSSAGVLQCWDMKAMRFEVWLTVDLLAFAFITRHRKNELSTGFKKIKNALIALIGIFSYT